MFAPVFSRHYKINKNSLWYLGYLKKGFYFLFNMQNNFQIKHFPNVSRALLLHEAIRQSAVLDTISVSAS